MKFLVITHVLHKKQDDQYFAYAPYVREMNLWFRHVDQVIVVAPCMEAQANPIDQAYVHEHIDFHPVPAFQFTSLKSTLQASVIIPKILWALYRAMRQADHIHLRCPGNMGLLGLIVQILFPSKFKTAKYAGEWPNYPKEPKSYRLQKYISKSSLWSKNTKVLIYGEWPGFTANCKPFFTASYASADAKMPITYKELNPEKPIKIIFVGTLDERKRPEYAIETVAMLRAKGYKAEAAIFGEGPHKVLCQDLIKTEGLDNYIKLFGNVPPRNLISHYKEAHFLVFLSRMEGWPKVVAEAMFWGCVPVTTAISCVPWMLGNGERGCIVERSPQSALKAIEALVLAPERYSTMQTAAIAWARQYTLERFEQGMIELLH